MAMLAQNIPEINWHVRTNKYGDLKSSVDKYCEDDHSMIEFHICPSKGCCAFVADYSKDKRCRICNEPRFTKCKHISCNNRDYNECNHKIENRVSLKSMFYRPFTSLLYNLLKTEGFIHAINFNFLDQTESYKYMDCSDGSTYKNNLNDMKLRYEEKFGKLEKKPQMINILLGQFYDGCQIFKKKYSVFWPLNAIILNLPPSYRIKLGIGMFLVSIFTARSKSNAEDFLLRSLVVGELKRLNEGVLLTVNGVDFFLQARMILTILDGIAVQDFLKVQGNQSYAGCFMCRNGTGYGHRLNRIVFVGHRRLTDLRHYTRDFGQSKKCCPPNYYPKFTKNKRVYKSSVEDDVAFEDISAQHDLTSKKTANEIFHTDIPFYRKGVLIVCYQGKSEEIKEFLNSGAKGVWVWYHKDPEFNFVIFQNDLWFHNCDYRAKVGYTRKTNDEYLQFGSDARLKLKNNPKLSKNDRAVNGVHDNWAMSELPYCDVETDLCWGPFHSMCNVALNIIDNWKNERITSKTIDIIEYCKATGTHPDLYRTFKQATKNKSKPNESNVDAKIKYHKWGIKPLLQDKIEAYIVALNIPLGFSSDFQAQFIFQQTGYLHWYG